MQRRVQVRDDILDIFNANGKTDEPFRDTQPLSLPAVAAAGLLEAWQARDAIFGTSQDLVAAAVGTLTAAVVGFLAIRWLLSALTRHTLWPFVIYRLALAGLLAAWLSGWRPSVEGISSAIGSSETSSARPDCTISRPVT